MKKYHYVYLTTNLLNGKQYVGDHSTYNLNDGYLGSGKILKDSIRKNGKENFKREILKICESKNKAFDLQIKYINEYNTLAPNGYNISPKGGSGTREWHSHSPETKKKMSESHKGKKLSISHREKISNSNRGVSRGKGQVKSTEHKQKMSESHKGVSRGPHSIEHRKKISESEKGKKVSGITRKKISMSAKGKTWEERYGVEGALKRRTKNKKL